VSGTDLSEAGRQERAQAAEQKRQVAHVAALIRAFKGIHSRPQIIRLAKLGIVRQEKLLAEKSKK
jgi:hypothetical protein